ncbi:3-hydroxyisobutyrate dehydrogenase [Salinisphaera sp.]|uniref:3-hydroxyisobutyrate dehydrogenase n=1 Tax=Salinisphaera sp. TaxID=1914330 RepID=UPI000C60DE2C|nr:3-hydroxyisobutyrate dehydrogenase [Salinisphaera sp.]MBS61548.1 3-hydroxyisobutyrate dehydrogenase [Salinisphaera sp.]
MAKEIAFIGLGNMGAPMAANLIKAGYALTVFDLVEQAMADAVALGAERAESAAAAAQQADIVISMLPAGQHVAALYQGEGGLLDVVGQETLLVDCSTIDAETARQVAAAAGERGLSMLDAPVSGGVNGAKAGGLTFMVGGEAAAVEKASALFDVMGKTYFHAGPAGAGQVAKMCNNMLLGILMTGTSEAINLAVANGLDPSVVSDIMKNASGGNWALNVYNPYPGVMDNAPASNGYKPGFGVDLMLKDLGLAMDSSLKKGVATPLGSMARNLYSVHSQAGHGGDDFSSILNLLQGYSSDNANG